MDKINRRKGLWIFALFMGVILAGCSAAPSVEVAYDPDKLRFNGERTLEIERQFASLFPNRHSGQENNRLALEWLSEEYSALGIPCQMDEWEVINYSEPVTFRNLICTLEGEQTEGEIVLTSHQDQASTTVEGADNDASGVAIMLHLAEILSREGRPKRSIVFLTADGEEYGNLGTRRFTSSHPDLGEIIAAVSLDNLGRPYYNGMDIESIGQFRNYGSLWLALAAREAAAASDQIIWEVYPDPIDEQVTAQAGPANFMDQGPFVASGVPSLGFAAHKPDECVDLHYDLWHDPRDSMEVDASELNAPECIQQTDGRVALQTAGSLGQSGLISEALVRQLLSMDEYPASFAPYFYSSGSEQILGPLPINLIAVIFVVVFFLGAALISGRDMKMKLSGWAGAVPHFLSLWLPLVGGVILLYGFVAVGLMLRFESYPAATKDPYILHPRYEVYLLLAAGMAAMFFLGRRLAARFSRGRWPDHAAIKSFGMLVIGIGCLYPLAVNPISLIFCIPLLLWFLITGKGGLWRVLDILLFLVAGMPIYGMIYYFGWISLRYGFVFTWYMLHMFSTGMISFMTVLVSMGMIAAGLIMIIQPPGESNKEREVAEPGPTAQSEATS